eukprot:1757912-Rhodomonas_salina.1
MQSGRLVHQCIALHRMPQIARVCRSTVQGSELCRRHFHLTDFTNAWSSLRGSMSSPSGRAGFKSSTVACEKSSTENVSSPTLVEKLWVAKPLGSPPPPASPPHQPHRSMASRGLS